MESGDGARHIPGEVQNGSRRFYQERPTMVKATDWGDYWRNLAQAKFVLCPILFVINEKLRKRIPTHVVGNKQILLANPNSLNSIF